MIRTEQDVPHLCAMIAIDLSCVLDRIRELKPRQKLAARSVVRAGESIGSAAHIATYEMPWHTVTGHLAGVRALASIEAVRALVLTRAGERAFASDDRYFYLYIPELPLIVKRAVQARHAWRSRTFGFRLFRLARPFFAEAAQ